MKNFLVKMTVISASVLAFASCNKNDDNITPSYTVPTTYTFTGVDSVPAKITLAMIAQMETEMNKGNTTLTVLNAAKLKAMYANTGNYFTDISLNGTNVSLNNSSIKLKSSTVNAAAQTYIEALLDSVAESSKSTTAPSSGVAGAAGGRLLSGNGVYWRQVFTKALMGVIIGHQITDVYLGDSLNANTSLTAKQHAWDQAFFLWGVPVNFPANRAGVKYWGSYTSQIDSGLNKAVVNNTGINSNVTLLNAFLKGRAALANNDLATAQAQAKIITATFEKIEAAAALHELNEAKVNTGGEGAVAGNVSESIGFWMALKFNAKKATISDAQITTIGNLFGTNLYKLTHADFETIKSAISTIYGWDAVKGYL